eukprot:scaffold307831_cov19-Prasinocladus_malaysianus.AAC.1
MVLAAVEKAAYSKHIKAHLGGGGHGEGGGRDNGVWGGGGAAGLAANNIACHQPTASGTCIQQKGQTLIAEYSLRSYERWHQMRLRSFWTCSPNRLNGAAERTVADYWHYINLILFTPMATSCKCDVSDETLP